MDNVVSNWTINFGKYKGEKYCDLPDEYVDWIVETEFFKKEPKVDDAELKDRYRRTNKMISDYLIWRTMNDE